MYEKTRSRPDLQVISLSVDDNPVLAETHVRQNGYTFPVLVAGRLFWEQNFPPALPMSWLIDPAGRRSEDPVRGRGEEWVNRMLQELQKAISGLNP